MSPPLLLEQPLPERAPTDVSLADLKAFFTHPVRSFLRGRLEVSTPLEPDEVSDAIPIQLDNLEVWQVGDELLREVLAGQSPVAVMTAQMLSDKLPPDRLGFRTLDGVRAQAQALWDRTTELRSDPPRSVDVDVDLGDGRRLTGTVLGVHGSRLLTLGYSRLKAKQRLMIWIDLLALTAGHPAEHFTAHAVGREKAGPKRALSGPLDHRAAGMLTALVALRERGLCEPLPVPIATTAAWAEAHLKEQMGQDVSPLEQARRAWESDPHNAYGIKGEDADPWHERAYGAHAPVELLLDAGLAELAWTIWSPLLTGGERIGPL